MEPGSADPRPNELQGAATPNVLGQRSGQPVANGVWGAPSPMSSPSRNLVLVLVLAFVVIVIAGSVYVISAGPRDACAVVDELIAVDVPERTIREPRAWMPGGVLPGYRVSWDGPMNLEQVVASRVNPEDVRLELTRDGFVDAYEQEWEGTLEVGFAAYRFTTTRGAQAFNAFGNRFACQFANEAFRGPRGSIGLQVRYGSGQIGEQISWVTGDTRIVVISFQDDAPPDHSAIEALLGQVPNP